MILYLDTSALVKRYIRETGSDELRRWLSEADLAAVSLIAYPEANAAFARAVRAKAVSQRTGEKAVSLLAAHWPRYMKLPVSERINSRAAELAWSLGLRGYDAVHLASAERWQTSLGRPIVLVTDDRQLAAAGRQLSFCVQPESN